MKPEWKKEAYQAFVANKSIAEIARLMWSKQTRKQWGEYGYSKISELKNDLPLYIENWSDI